MENREMFDEINALVGAVATALDVSEIEVVTAIEQGRLGMELQSDDEGRNFVAVTCDGKSVRIYQGAIFREGANVHRGDGAPDTHDEECGGGCSCGK